MDLFQKNRTFFLIEGVIFIILGMLAIILPQITTLTVELFIGWLFVIGGALQLYRTFTSVGAPGFWPSLFGSVFSIVVGVLLLVYPVAGILSLTLLLTIFFFLDGISKVILAIEYRNTIKRWGWLVFSGITSIILALIIWSGWPGTATWVIGLLIGINMIFFGFSLLSIGSIVKSVDNQK